MLKNNAQLAIFFSADEKRLNFLEPMLPIFIDQLNKSISKVVKAKQDNDLLALVALAHKIKGSALTYGAKPISSEIILIEDELTQAKSTSSIDLSKLISAAALLNEIYPINNTEN